MDWPPPGLEFNTKKFDKYHHVIQYATDGQDKTVKICRCWQSKRFPYCDDTHKVLIEAGDNVGPYVAKIQGGPQAANVASNTLTKRSQVPKTAAAFFAGFTLVGLACAAAAARRRGLRGNVEVSLGDASGSSDGATSGERLGSAAGAAVAAAAAAASRGASVE
eukprot:TRINITY_DN75656_c0_g1_i1.p1 TRINITY_DN75656_c0_g1~~TRINITY_DN75656_c0_g1_i1.p1  ORF type:complete len:190 (-),score=53.36 TRINITY_DN75656_c0_g1_i1:197-685(-)